MISLEKFSKLLNEENLSEMKKLQMPVDWAYKEFLVLLEEQTNDLYIDVNDGVKTIILEYIEGLLYKDFNKYELDFE